MRSTSAWTRPGRGLRRNPARAELRQGHREHRPAGARAGRLDCKLKAILSFVRQNNSADDRRSSSTEENRRQIHITDLHNWAGTLNTESDVNYPCYRPWLTFTVVWDSRVSLCCADFDGRTIWATSTRRRSRHLERRPYRQARRLHLESGGPDICRSCDLPRDSPLWVTKLA
jgi:hypothetical protein